MNRKYDSTNSIFPFVIFFYSVFKPFSFFFFTKNLFCGQSSLTNFRNSWPINKYNTSPITVQSFTKYRWVSFRTEFSYKVAFKCKTFILRFQFIFVDKTIFWSVLYHSSWDTLYTRKRILQERVLPKIDVPFLKL